MYAQSLNKKHYIFDETEQNSEQQTSKVESLMLNGKGDGINMVM